MQTGFGLLKTVVVVCMFGRHLLQYVVIRVCCTTELGYLTILGDTQFLLW